MIMLMKTQFRPQSHFAIIILVLSDTLPSRPNCFQKHQIIYLTIKCLHNIKISFLYTCSTNHLYPTCNVKLLLKFYESKENF